MSLVNLKGYISDVVTSFSLDRDTVRRIADALETKGTECEQQEYFASARLNFETAIEILKIAEPDNYRISGLEQAMARATESEKKKYS